MPSVFGPIVIAYAGLAAFDWAILIVFFILLVFGGALCRRYVKGVADYCVAGRKMGKFLGLSTWTAEGLGLISIVTMCEQGFTRGFAYIWLMLIYLVLPLIVYGVFGIVIMPYRKQKVLTLAQYFEKRYNKPVRVLTGFVQAFSGVMNLAIFPIMGSVFLVYFMGFPEKITLMGFQMAPAIPLMTIMIILALFFTFIGGMVSVILTDFIQSIIIAVALIAGSIALLTRVDIGTIHTTLQTHMGSAGYNPFAEGSYGFIFFAWLILGIFGGIAFGPQLQRIASADSAGTARKMTLYGMIFMQGRSILLLAWGIVALGALGAAAPEGIAEKMWVKVAPAIYLGDMFPIVIKGLFLSGLIAAFISTVDSYFLSWSAIITNDLICPFLKRPLSHKQHIRLIRLVVVAIAVFIWVFGVVYKPTESVMFFLMLTGSMFHGTGYALAGGLYLKWATAPAAFTTITVMCSVPFLDLLFRRIIPDYADSISAPAVGFLNTCLGIFLFIVVSLLTHKRAEKDV